MNWYKFKIELVGVLCKTMLCTLLVLFYLKTLQYLCTDAFLLVPEPLGFFVAHDWILPVGMWVLLGLLWLCYFRIFRIYRGRAAYGER